MTGVAELLAQARSATGLDDFGDDSFREGLGILVASATREARFTPAGRAAFFAQLVELLSQRLQVEDWYRRHPEIDEQQIVAPLIGLGLPRTGSSALSMLLAEDPAVRVIVNPGGTNEAWVRANLGRAQIRVHPDNRTVFGEIVAGRADAMVTDDVEAELQTRRHPQLCRTLPGTLTRSEKAVLMPRDAALQAAVDDWLQRQLDAGLPATVLREALAQ